MRFSVYGWKHGERKIDGEYVFITESIEELRAMVLDEDLAKKFAEKNPNGVYLVIDVRDEDGEHCEYECSARGIEELEKTTVRLKGGSIQFHRPINVQADADVSS